jgi:hypothetical protein
MVTLSDGLFSEKEDEHLSTTVIYYARLELTALTLLEWFTALLISQIEVTSHREMVETSID